MSNRPVSQKAAPPELTPEGIAQIRERFGVHLAETRMSFTERYENRAERFYRETGFMAPGKSQPLEMYGGEAQEERRQKAWDDWNRALYVQFIADSESLLTLVESQGRQIETLTKALADIVEHKDIDGTGIRYTFDFNSPLGKQARAALAAVAGEEQP